MKKTFKLDGLDCASCAAKIEKGVAKLDGVENATVNFATAKLTIEGDADKMENIIEAAGAIAKKSDAILRKA